MFRWVSGMTTYSRALTRRRVFSISWASVVVSALDGGMTDTDAARIGEIVREQTGLRADQIKIIEAE